MFKISRNILKIINITFLFSTLFVVISCDAFQLFSKDEYMKLREKGSGSHNVVEVQLEDAANVSYGYGEFGAPTGRICKTDGSGFVNGVDFNYGSVLDIYDNNDNGDFDTGKYFRIIVNGDNVTDGLGLTPVAMDLSSSISPPNNEVYIDPIRRKFILPRPSYWSKCTNLENLLLTSEIFLENPSILGYNPSYCFFVPGKYGIGIYDNYPYGTGMTLSPFGTDFIGNYKYTISLWVKLLNLSNRSPAFKINFGDNYILLQSASGTPGHSININGTGSVDSDNTDLDGEYHHIYVLIDSSIGLDENTKSVIVFIDGSEKMSYASTFTVDSNINLWFGSASTAQVLAYFDNIKIWKEIVLEDSSWIFDTDSETILSPIYGLSTNYIPVNIQTGYYYY